MNKCFITLLCWSFTAFAQTVELPRGSAEPRGPSRPDTLIPVEGEAPPPGYLDRKQVRLEVVLTGAGAFLISYLATTFQVLGEQAGRQTLFLTTWWAGSQAPQPLSGAAFLPIGGGLVAAEAGLIPVWAGALSAAVQAGGLLMTVIGLERPRHEWVLDRRSSARASIELTPTGLGGTF